MGAPSYGGGGRPGFFCFCCHLNFVCLPFPQTFASECVSATVDAAALGPVPAPPAAFVAAVAAVVAADDSAGSIFLNASSLLGEAPKSCPSSFLSLCVICSLDSLVAGVKPELIEKHAYAHVLSLTVSYIAVRYANHPLRALSLSFSLSIFLFLSLCGPQHNISHIVASRVSTTAIVSTHNPLTLPPSWRSSPVGETASQHFCFTHRIVLVTWRALLSLSFLSETPKQSPSRNCPSRCRS